MNKDERYETIPSAPFAQTIEALRAAAGLLVKARDETSDPAAAVQKNSLVWALLIEETAAPGNAFPEHLRDVIQKRGIEAIKLGQKLLLEKKPDLLDALIKTGIRTARELKAV